MDREKITLTGAQETMLATLYARALDSRSPRSILHDAEADRAIGRIDYDFRKTGIKAGATLHWGVDDPRVIEGLHEGLKCMDAVRSVDMDLDKLPASGRLACGCSRGCQGSGMSGGFCGIGFRGAFARLEGVRLLRVAVMVVVPSLPEVVPRRHAGSVFDGSTESVLGALATA
jgi:hypothetical protein